MGFKNAVVVGLIGLATLAVAMNVPQVRALIVPAPPAPTPTTTGIIGAIGEAFTGFF